MWFQKQPCQSCELLKELLHQERTEKAQLLHIVIEKFSELSNRSQVVPSVPEMEDFEPFQRKSSGLVAMREMLERQQSEQKARDIANATRGEEKLTIEDLEESFNK